MQNTVIMKPDWRWNSHVRSRILKFNFDCMARRIYTNTNIQIWLTPGRITESLQKLELPFYRLTHKDYRFDVVIAFHLCDYTFISKCTLEPIIASRKATEVRIILKLWIYFILRFRIFLLWEQLSLVMHDISTVCYRYKTAWKSIRGFQQNWS